MSQPAPDLQTTLADLLFSEGLLYMSPAWLDRFGLALSEEEAIDFAKWAKPDAVLVQAKLTNPEGRRYWRHWHLQAELVKVERLEALRKHVSNLSGHVRITPLNELLAQEDSPL